MEQPRARFCSNCGAPLTSDARFCHVCGAAVVASPVAQNIDAVQPTPTPAFSPPIDDSQPAPPTPASPQAWPTTMPAAATYASFGERFIAYMIDVILLALSFWVAGFILAIIVFASAGTSEAAEVLVGVVVTAMAFVVHWLYFALQESSAKQATFGKRAMKIVVTDERGQRLTFGRATGRAFARFLSSMFFSLGYLIALFTARKQALHDLIASTIVTRR